METLEAAGPKPQADELSVYEMSINIRICYQAHSMNNIGNRGTNQVFPRTQLLADGFETDACSGDSFKHYHCSLLTDYLLSSGMPVCEPCATGDARRIAALMDKPEGKSLTMQSILKGCGICDTHGFLVPGKNASEDREGNSVEGRQRLLKSTILEFSYGLGIPGKQYQTRQLNTRSGGAKGEGQMLFTKEVRSGEYAVLCRYQTFGIGADTERRELWIADQNERVQRHRAILECLRDLFLSPGGAMTAGTLAQLEGLSGAIVVQPQKGRAYTYSPLEDKFIDKLTALGGERVQVYPFHTVVEFNKLMDMFVSRSVPQQALLFSRQKN